MTASDTRSGAVGRVRAARLPGTGAIPVVALKRGPRIPYVRDPWPDPVAAGGFIGGDAGRAARAVPHRFCDTSHRMVSRTAVTSPGMAEVVAMGANTRKYYLAN